MNAALRALVLCLIAGACLGAAPAQAVSVGMSDGRPELFDAQQLHDVDFRYVRLVLPWDAGQRDGSWNTWLTRATAQHWPVLVSPTWESGPAPTAGEYQSALTKLLDRYPTIDSVEGWNEPNHSGQPTAGDPALAARYFEAARKACGSRCTAVAGNLLDASSMGGYLAAYRAALTTEPAVWGVHNYYDSTYFQSSGIGQTLAVARGEVWMTETGGLVSFQPNGPGTGLLPDEARAADSLRWLFTLAQSQPRVTRMYLYGMWQQPWNAFDSALLRVDNSERESMAVVRQYVGLRTVPMEGAPLPSGLNPASGESGAGASAAAAGTAATAASPGRPVLRLVGKRIAVDRRTRRARITVQCAVSACAGRLTVTAGRWSYRRGIQLAAGQQRTLTVRLGSRAIQATRHAHAAAALCASSVCSRIPLTLR